MESLEPIFEQFAESLKKDIKLVTKRFSKTIESEVYETGFQITGSPYISTLIDGRQPTRPNAPKGNPTLQEAIYDWIKLKGIISYPDESGKVMDQKSLSWAISQSIHMHGDLLYQRGGGNDIFAPIINQARINAFSNSIGGVFAQSISSDVVKNLK